MSKAITPEKVFQYAEKYAPRDYPHINWSDMVLDGIHTQTHNKLTIKMTNTKTKEVIYASVWQ